MGCGAVCGSSSSITQSSKQAEIQFMNLFQQIIPNKFLYPIKAIANFAREMKLYPHKFNLILTQKLQAKSIVPSGVMQKWKIILFGLDTNNSTYINCLGYPQNVNKTKSIAQKPTDDQNSNQRSVTGQTIIQNTELLQHKVFAQIEKDIERTFPGYEFEKKAFTSILKRITNHFPVMGYTQGINFIVGYLLIIGYSQFDTFWLFVHMATNRRYLMLGLYQDGFPLINVYISIFRNMLKRINNKLYKHLYEDVEMFDESAWVFKWFMTCYLSNFPLEMCQYVWDLVLCTGGIGLVKFAISLVTKLEKQLLELGDACELAHFFGQLKQVQTFNSYLSIRQLIKTTYSLKVQRSDLIDLEHVKTQRGGKNFYAEYFLVKFEQDYQSKMKTAISQQQSDANKTGTLFLTDPTLFKQPYKNQSCRLLDGWYTRLIEQRKQFRIQAQIKLTKNSKTNMSQMIQQEISIDLVSSNRQIERIEVIELSSQIKQPKIQRKHRPSIEHFDSLQGLIIQSDLKKEPKIQRLDSVPNSPKNKPKISTISNRYGGKKSKQLITFDDDDDQQEQNEERKDKMQMEDELFYISKDIRFKRKNVEQQPSDILSQFSNPTKTKQNRTVYQVKVSTLKADSVTEINVSMQRSRLARAGNSVLSNMSASNASGRSSNSSHRTIYKENTIGVGRACKCMKNKTEQNNIETLPATRKQIKISKKPQQIYDNQHSMENMPNLRKRLNTSHNWMTNSQGPTEVKNMTTSNVKQASEIGSQIQIHNMKMFKKKNKANRIDQFGIVHHCQNKIEHQQQISQYQSRHDPIPILGQQQSCQSFFIGNASQHKSQICEVESVK